MTEEVLTVRCACGWEASGSEEEVVPLVQEHGLKVHNMVATREEIVATAARGPLGAADEVAAGESKG